MPLLMVLYSSILIAGDVSVVTLAIGEGYKDAVSKGIENKQKYCKQHDYEFIISEESLDPARHPAWSKILLLLQSMKSSSSEWFFWTDADSLVMNMAIPLEDLIDEKYNLIIAKDFNGINSGQFLIRNCEWSINFLQNVYAHTECINHPWWEQQAIILELAQKQDVKDATKIIPQRLMNSYPIEFAEKAMNINYQPGDFIIHFAGVHGNEALKGYFDTYSKQVLNSLDALSLDSYLAIYNFKLSPQHSSHNEGYMTETQKLQFISSLAQHPEIKTIAEIGLNGGHSAENFFKNCPNLEKMTSFDLNSHRYAFAAVEFFKRKYRNKFEFIQGNSLETIPAYAAASTGTTFDLIYVDGNHSYECCFNDIINFRLLATPDTILWVDDYSWFVQNAVDECVKKGIITITKVHHCDDPCGPRAWIEAKYRFD